MTRGGCTQQTGSTLIVTLIMLLLITLIAMGGMRDSMMQHQMTRNLEDRKMAFEGAEKALEYAEQRLNEPRLSTFAGHDKLDPNPPESWYSTGNVFAIDKVDERAADLPSFQYGEMRCVETAMQGCPVEVFTITSMGVGGERQTKVFLTSRFARIQD